MPFGRNPGGPRAPLPGDPGGARATLGAPLGFLGGWLLLGVIDGDRVAGVWWTAAHAVWLASMIGFVLLGVGLRAGVRPGVRGAVACGS